MKNKFNDKIIILLAVVIFLEIFVFNFRFFQGLRYNTLSLDNFTFDETKAEITDISGNEKTIRFYDNNVELVFDEFDEKVNNIFIDIEDSYKLPENADFNGKKRFEEGKSIKYRIIIDDDSKSSGIEMPEKNVIYTIEKTKYASINTKGNSHNLKIRLSNVNGKDIIIHNISINKGQPFRFNILRVLFLFIFAIIIYIIRPGSEFYKKELDLKDGRQIAVIAILALIQIIILCRVNFINYTYVYNNYPQHFEYQELADAILDGHFYLKDEPDPMLSQIDNPYDPADRSNNGVNFKFDHAYYNGKYYVYFGIIPALIFNIPIKVLFNIDISVFACHTILIPIYVVVCYLLLLEFIRKYFYKKESIPFILFCIISVLFVNGTEIIFNIMFPGVYELPIFMSIIFTMLGIYMWLVSLRKNKNGIPNGIFIAIGSLCMALVAGCRPQMLLGLFLAIPIFKDCIFKERKLFSKESSYQTALFILPIALFAAFMFFYNYMRFGSIFDFGANYNLTSNDMTARSITMGRAFQGLFYFILQPMNTVAAFPYITNVNFVTEYMGTTIFEESFGGILFIQPFLWILLMLPKVSKELKNKGLYMFTLMTVIFTLIIAVADSEMAGIVTRYFMDFAVFTYMGAIFVLFSVYNKYKNSDCIKILEYFVVLSFIISLFINLGILLTSSFFGPKTSNPEDIYKIMTFFKFWT